MVSHADCVTFGLGKSTYARCGIVVNVTPFEPEWEGYVTNRGARLKALRRKGLELAGTQGFEPQ